jgi:hypothetical protein
MIPNNTNVSIDQAHMADDVKRWLLGWLDCGFERPFRVAVIGANGAFTVAVLDLDDEAERLDWTLVKTLKSEGLETTTPACVFAADGEGKALPQYLTYRIDADEGSGRAVPFAVDLH